jgi:hypothetical protein
MGNDNRTNRKLFGNGRCVQRAATAVGDQGEVARIETALEGDVTHRVGHRRGGNLKHA